MSAGDKKNEDCYFFFYSTCTKGDLCPFRHSAVALGSEIVCNFWREGKCDKGEICKYRHMETQHKQRNKIECFFESQPGGCKKLHCAFMHRKQPKMSLDITEIESKDVILPVNEGSLLINKENSLDSKPIKIETNDQLGSPDSNHGPISLNIHISDESETESTLSNDRLAKKPKELDFGVKTLEQIRMEKILRQSNQAASSASTTDDKQSNKKPQIGAKTSVENETTDAGKKEQRLRLKRRNIVEISGRKRISSGSEIEPSESTKETQFGFQVKSLDDIRKERAVKKLIESSSSDQLTVNMSLIDSVEPPNDDSSTHPVSVTNIVNNDQQNNPSSNEHTQVELMKPIASSSTKRRRSSTEAHHTEQKTPLSPAKKRLQIEESAKIFSPSSVSSNSTTTCSHVSADSEISLTNLDTHEAASAKIETVESPISESQKITQPDSQQKPKRKAKVKIVKPLSNKKSTRQAEKTVSNKAQLAVGVSSKPVKTLKPPTKSEKSKSISPLKKKATPSKQPGTSSDTQMNALPTKKMKILKKVKSTKLAKTTKIKTKISVKKRTIKIDETEEISDLLNVDLGDDKILDESIETADDELMKEIDEVINS